MKTLLAILLSFIVSEAPVLAIHGGYSLGGSQSVVGTYAGVLIPTADTLLVATTTDYGQNALGLFALAIPSVGRGSGNVVVFSGGDTFSGVIQALANPKTDTGIVGIINAQYDYNLYVTTNGTTSTEAVTATAEGSFDAATVSNAESAGGLGLDLDGTSVVNVDQGFVSGTNGTPIITEKITFAIDGFQQSTSASTSGT